MASLNFNMEGYGDAHHFVCAARLDQPADIVALRGVVSDLFLGSIAAARHVVWQMAAFA
ncbi:hypothetical protein PDO_1992 [Rhizobium sp. PDO1-076]|uniref:hypothetical protein n=1 Tax=Rhizobium sp. PDO1-076 TaxID=1125979 RepID=UPI00024E21EB|nr:hypothetical protein [Rhizobium sp. PDO1-076]EHS51270.1 hypothetical protein PDO_1992 [Rhizobium sp. PDO1-076]